MKIKKHKIKKYRIVLNSKFQSGEKRYANKFHHTNESNNIKDADKILEFNSKEEAQEHIISHPSSLILRNYVIEEFEKEVTFWEFYYFKLFLVLISVIVISTLILIQ